MNTQQELMTIRLMDLPEKDQAVIQRVVSFGASQGKPYAITTETNTAHVSITLDNYPVTISNGLHLRIGDPGLPCDLLIQRPLLVTRVMRALDDAAQLLRSRQQPTVSSTPPLNTETKEPIQEILTNVSASIAHEMPEQHKDEYHYTALVVDDSAAIRKQLELELRDAQIRADFAETGEEALEKSAQKQYDLVFLDIILPGIDGYEVCRQMRGRKNMKKTPIIMLSGKTSPLDEVKGVIAGASTYLTKPVKHEQFQQTLKRVSKWLTNFAC